jgi:hypothetical protein
MQSFECVCISCISYIYTVADVAKFEDIYNLQLGLVIPIPTLFDSIVTPDTFKDDLHVVVLFNIVKPDTQFHFFKFQFLESVVLKN